MNVTVYDDVLEGEFAGPKIKHNFVYFKFLLGGWKKTFLKVGLRTHFTIGPTIFWGGDGAYPKGAKSAITPINVYFHRRSP